MPDIVKRFLKYLLYFISVVTILTIGLIAYLIWFQPPFYFPKPTGQYAVGVTDYHWIDESRKEIFADDPSHPNRELMVKIWYPSSLKLRRTGPAEGKLHEKPSTPYAPYLVDYHKKHNPILWLLALSRPTYTYATPDAPMLQGNTTFPVILFSHGGGGGTRDSNTVHCEELASHGYVVVGISHTYQSGVVEFPDGRIVDSTKDHFDSEHKNFIERRKITDEITSEIWVNDVRFVLDQLTKLTTSENSNFFQRIDLAHVGMFGQSMGGSTAIQSCRRDQRIKACVDLDGSLFGTDVTKNFDKPFMAIFAGDSIAIVQSLLSTKKNWPLFRVTSSEEATMVIDRYIKAAKELAQATGHDAFVFSIKDSGHLDFTNTTFLKQSSLPSRLVAYFKVGLTSDFGCGSIDSFRVTTIVNDYLVNFFDKYLKGQPSELLDGNGKRYAEVEKLKVRK